MSDESKSWWMSKTVWGGVVALIGGILGVFDYTLAPEDQALILEIAAGITTGVGGIVAIWGRTKASKTIGK